MAGPAAARLATGRLAAAWLATGRLAAARLATGRLAAARLATARLAAARLAAGRLARGRPTPVARRVPSRRIILGEPHAPTVGRAADQTRDSW